MRTSSSKDPPFGCLGLVVGQHLRDDRSDLLERGEALLLSVPNTLDDAGNLPGAVPGQSHDKDGLRPVTPRGNHVSPAGAYSSPGVRESLEGRLRSVERP